ncbi:serine/threonine-protein kinase [Blastococcus sp. SYSU D00695]
MELEQFGPYRIEAMLGRGGMGEVYRAYDTEHDRVVALKVLSEALAADSGYRERFRREAHLAARLNEPHIVPIHRYGEIEGRLFLDMRLVPGRDVAAVLAEEGAMDPARAVSIVSQTARALDSAHADGLVHRDVKPSNVLVTGSGDDEFVYLVDFGIARSTSDTGGPALTQTGAALGSFDYMAPERFLEKPIDKRVDVYALACVLFECLTARRPFTGDGLATLMYAHLNTEAPVPSAVRPGLPAKLDAVVRRGLAKDPDERYATCGELAAAARAALRDSGVAEAVIPAAPPTSLTPLPVRPQTVGFSNPGPGGYGPPSQPGTGGYPVAGTGRPTPPPTGGYGPPSHPGPPGFPPQQQPGRPTGYGPTGPGGPVGPGGPGGPVTSGGYVGGGASPSGNRRKNNKLPLVLGGVAVLVVLAVVLVIALSGGDDKGGGGTAGGTTPPPVTTTPPSTTPITTTPGGANGNDDEDTLRSIIPGGFVSDDCTTGEETTDGALAVLVCGASSSQPGPSGSVFYLYEDESTLDDVFLADVQRNGIPPLAEGASCPSTQGYGYYTINQQRAGRLACYVKDGDALLIWTQDDAGAEGLVAIEGGGEAGLTTLYDWWRSQANSDFGTP